MAYPRRPIRRRAKKVMKKRAPAKRSVRSRRPMRPRRAVRSGAIAQRIKHLGGQLSFSGAKHFHRADAQVRALERVGTVNNVVNQFAYTLTSPSGLQVNYAFSMFDGAQLRQLLQFVPSSQPKRCVVEGLTNEYTFQNFTNSPLELEIYDIALKRDVYTGYDFTTAVDTYIPATNPQSYWNQGMNSQSGAPTTSAGSAVVGTQPTDSQLFKDWFRITKRTSIMLPISGCHRHLVSIKTNRIVDTLLAGAPESVAGLREFTKYVLVNVKGLPVWNSVSANATVGACQLGIVAVQRLKYTFVQDFSFSSDLNQALTIPTAPATSIWNGGSGGINAVTGLTTLP